MKIGPQVDKTATAERNPSEQTYFKPIKPITPPRYNIRYHLAEVAVQKKPVGFLPATPSFGYHIRFHLAEVAEPGLTRTPGKTPFSQKAKNTKK
jgi:hypothetical protein